MPANKLVLFVPDQSAVSGCSDLVVVVQGKAGRLVGQRGGLDSTGSAPLPWLTSPRAWFQAFAGE